MSKTLTINEKLEKAGEEKELGNGFFKEGNLRKAIKKYHIALMYIKDLEKPSPFDKLAGIEPKKVTDSELHGIKSLRSVCYNNLSACLLKSEEYQKVIEYTSKALEYDQSNIKSLYRRGQAHFHTKDFDKSEKDFLHIKSIDPKETCYNSFMKKIEANKKVRTVNEKEIYRKMMDG